MQLCRVYVMSTDVGGVQLLCECWQQLPEKRLSAFEVLSRLEHMGVKSRFVELRESRQREERERKEDQKDRNRAKSLEPSAHN